MIIEKIKFTAHFENGIMVAKWIGIEISPGFEETADEAFKASVDQVQKWSEMYGNQPITGQQGPPVINVRDRIVPDADNDLKFQQLTETLEIIKYREEAQAYLDSTEFKMEVRARRIVNSKPNKHKPVA